MLDVMSLGKTEVRDVISHIDGQKLKGFLAEAQGDYQFIDVRTPEEYYGRHIDAFVNLPLQSLEYKADTLDANKPVVIICASGGRSMSAAHFLKARGFKAIYNVRGGMMAYR